MKRSESLTIIFAQFDKEAKEFSERTNGLFCELSSVYKGKEEPQNLKNRFAKIYYNSFMIEFVYTAHGKVEAVNSILSCRVYLDKNENSVGIPLPLLTDYCDKNVLIPLTIPFISNSEGMVQAFACFSTVFEALLPLLSAISSDFEEKTRILKAYTDEMNDIFKINNANEMLAFLSDHINEYCVLRFSSIAFINYMRGNRLAAVQQLQKSKPLTGYEKRLIHIWDDAEQSDIPNLSTVVKNAEIYSEKGNPKVDFKEFGASFVSWLVLTPAISAAYIVLYFLVVYMEGAKSVYLMGPIYNFPIAILFGFGTAIAASYFTRFKFYKWFFKKDYERYCELDYIQNGGGADKIMKGFLRIVAVIGIIGCILLAKWNLNFLSDGFVDNSKFFSLKGEYYSYTQIEKVYYKPDRVNDFGETLDFPSYVIVLKNGEEIDLYEHGEISDYEDKLLKHLRDEGVNVEEHL